MIDDEFMRWARETLKTEFWRWRIPPTELPADSVIESALRKILENYKATRLLELDEKLAELARHETLV